MRQTCPKWHSHPDSATGQRRGAMGQTLPYRRGSLRQCGAGSHLVQRTLMTLGTILLIILIVLLIGAVPSWPYSRGWGYYPAGGLGLVLIIILILVLMGRV